MKGERGEHVDGVYIHNAGRFHFHFKMYLDCSLVITQVTKDGEKVEVIDIGQKKYYVFGRNQDMAGILHWL